MGGRHIGGVGGLGQLQVKGEVFKDVLPGLPAQSPAVQQLAVLGIAGDRHNLRAELQKGGQQLVPAVRALRHGLFDQLHGLRHIFQIIAHRGGYLGHRLGAAGAGILNHGTAVAVEKEHDTAAENDGHHTHYHGHQDGGGTQPGPGGVFFHRTSPAFSCSSLRRRALGDSPQYFLKQ